MRRWRWGIVWAVACTGGPSDSDTPTSTDRSDDTEATDGTDDTDAGVWWPPNGTVIQGATIVDGDGARGPGWVILDGDLIASVHYEDPGPAPAGIEIIDATGKFLTPGLVDPHVHLYLDATTVEVGNTLQSNLRSTLWFGVTSVVDAGGPETGAGLLEMAGRQDWQGPAVQLLSPFITVPGAHPCEVYNQPSRCWYTQSPGDGAALAQRAIDWKFSGIKLAISDAGHTPWPTPKPDLAEAKAAAQIMNASRGLVYAHVNTEQDAIEALDLGADHLAHSVFGGTLSSAGASDIAARATAVHTTFGAFDNTRALLADEVDWSGLASVTPEPVLANWRYIRDNPDVLVEGWIENTAEWNRANLVSTAELHAKGAPLLPASDAGYLFVPHGLGLHRELAELERQGWSRQDILLAATVGSAQAVGWTDRGRIQRAKRADLLVLDADPLADLSALRDPEIIIAGGRAWTRETLLSAWAPVAQVQRLPSKGFCIDDQDCQSGSCDDWYHVCHRACETAWSVDNTCGRHAICAAGEPEPVCQFVRACDPLNPSACQPDWYQENCVPADRDNGICWPAGPRGEWETCGAVDPTTFCEAGLTCSPIDGLCYRMCDPDETVSSCRAGTTCQMQQVGGKDWYALCLP